MMTLQQMIDQGVREAWLNPDNVLRPSVLADPAFSRKNTKDNTPAMVVVELIEGAELDITVASKGGGSEAKSKFAMLNPSDSITDWVLKTVPTMGAGWCPPGMLGIGIGGTAEKAMTLAKESLMDPIDMHELLQREASGATLTNIEKLRIDLYTKVNQLGIGAQGLGGLTTVLDIKIKDFPTHAANLPVAMIPNCAATRHLHIHLDGSGPVQVAPPTSLSGPSSTTPRRTPAASTSRPSPATTSAPGKPAKSSCSPANSSPAATPPTSASPTCSTAAKPSPSTSATASSTTLARSTPSATKSSAPPAPPPPPAWTSSPARCSPRPACSA
jgi:tartrate/fumarate subfamily iron-sulfur-dependent hydro-lyase alpha chain